VRNGRLSRNGTQPAVGLALMDSLANSDFRPQKVWLQVRQYRGKTGTKLHFFTILLFRCLSTFRLSDIPGPRFFQDGQQIFGFNVIFFDSPYALTPL
jgi:hypothetical protein